MNSDPSPIKASVQSKLAASPLHFASPAVGTAPAGLGGDEFLQGCLLWDPYPEQEQPPSQGVVLRVPRT